MLWIRTGTACFWASRIWIHQSEVRIRIRFRPFPFSESAKMSRIPHNCFIPCRKRGDDDADWPEDAALVVRELARGTYGSAPKCHGSPTHCLIPCRRRWQGNDWPENAALAVDKGVPVHLELDPDPDLLVRGTYGSAPKCHGSPTQPYSMPEAWQGNDWPEDAALVVGEGVPVHLELDPDPDLLVRGTYVLIRTKMSQIPNTQPYCMPEAVAREWCSRCRWGRPCASRVGSGSRSISQRYRTYGSAPKRHGSPTQSIIPCRKRWRGNDYDWPEDAALVVGEGVPVHPGEPEPGEGEEGAHQPAPRGNAQLAHQLGGRAWSILGFWGEYQTVNAESRATDQETWHGSLIS